MGNVDSVKYFMREGADLNAPSYGGVTALEEAARHANNVTMVRFLVEAGGNVNAKDGNGGTALISASRLGYLDNAIVLMQAGADVNLSDATGRTALMYASYRGHSDMVLALIKAGAKLNRTDNNGTSALMHAVWGCHADTVHTLMQAGATLTATDWQKDRPPQYEDFPTKKIYRGTQSAVDLRSNSIGPTYPTRLKQASRGKPDFAGHYIVAEWGCGSNCQSFNFINAVNGAIIEGVAADRGACYQLNSRLFIADPPIEGVAYEGHGDSVGSVPIGYYEMRNSKLTLIYQQACRVSDNRQQCGCEDLHKLVLPKAK